MIILLISIIFIIIVILILVILLQNKNKIKENLFMYEDLIITKKALNNIKNKKNIKIHIPIYYINLDRSIDRMNNITNQFKKFNILNFKRIKAIDGRDIKNKETDRIDNITFFNNYNNLTKYEIACTLSHLKAIIEAYNNNLKEVLIIEDDCSFDLLNIWDYNLENIIDMCPKNWEIIQLFSVNTFDLDNKNIYFIEHKVGIESSSTVAYIINKKGIEKIINNIKPFITLGKKIKNNLFPRLGTSDNFIYDIATTYTINIPLFYPDNSKFDSTIHNYHISYQNKMILKILNYYTNNLENNNKLDNRNVYIYWTGKEYKLISILREIIYKFSKKGNGYNIIFLNDDNYKKYISIPEENFSKLIPAHKADIIRVNIVCDIGGIWIDSDTLILDNLDSLFDIFKDKNGFFIKENNTTVWNGIFGSKPNTRLMLKWKDYVNNKILNDSNIESWAFLGNEFLNKEENLKLLNNYEIFEGLDTVYPVNWDKCVDEFLNKPFNNYKNIIRNFQPLIVLVNSVYKQVENKNKEEIIYSDNALSYFLQKALITDNKINNYSIPKYIIITEWIIDYITAEHYEFCKELEKLGWSIIYLKNLNIQKLQSQKCIVLCVTYDDFDINKLIHKNIYLIYKIDDLEPYKSIRNDCINACDMLIGPYTYLFKNYKNKYSNILNKIHYQNYYSCVPKFFYDIEFNKNPINKIFISGASNSNYPFRNYLFSLSKNDSNFEILKHPSYHKKEHNIINKEYYNKLNKYVCCFVDASKFKYILLKIFEVTSVGSLLLVDDMIEKELNKIGFLDNINCIMCNKNNINEKINYILNNRNIINNIRLNGFNLSRAQHNTIKRAIDFNNYIFNSKDINMHI